MRSTFVFILGLSCFVGILIGSMARLWCWVSSLWMTVCSHVTLSRGWVSLIDTVVLFFFHVIVLLGHEIGFAGSFVIWHVHVGPWLRCLGLHLYLSVNLLVVFIILGGGPRSQLLCFSQRVGPFLFIISRWRCIVCVYALSPRGLNSALYVSRQFLGWLALLGGVAHCLLCIWVCVGDPVLFVLWCILCLILALGWRQQLE